MALLLEQDISSTAANTHCKFECLQPEKGHAVITEHFSSTSGSEGVMWCRLLRRNDSSAGLSSGAPRGQ